MVPCQLHARVLGLVHGQVSTGHFGITKTLIRLHEHFYRPNCCTDSELFVHLCDVCTAQKGPTQCQRFPLSNCGNCYVLVAMDYLTKWVEAYTVPNQSAATTARFLVNKFFCRFGSPEKLHSDQGKKSEGEVFSAVCAGLGITSNALSKARLKQCGGYDMRSHSQDFAVGKSMCVLHSKRRGCRPS